MSGGGAASQIRNTNSASSGDKSSILILAGGGGGGGNSLTAVQLSRGGDGGGTVGETPPTSVQYGGNRIGGTGGGQTPGSSSISSWSTTGDGYPSGSQISRNNLQGAGGGGYYGGGQRDNSTGGGGGSSYIGDSRLTNAGTYTGSIGYGNPASANPLTGDVDGKKHGYIRIIANVVSIDPIPTSNISLSILKAKYVEYDVISGEGNSNLRDSSTTSTINLSYFNGVTLSDFTIIQPPISFSHFSGEALLKGYDYPTFMFNTSFRSQTSFSISSTTSYGTNKKVQLITSGQTSFGNILPVVKGVNGNNPPAISPTSEYSLWVKLTANSKGDYMIGLINRESWRSSWATCVSDTAKIKNQDATYADRIMFHSGGYFSYSGNYKPSGMDPVLGTGYSGLGSIFYNKMGSTAGTGGVTSSGKTFNLDNSHYFKPSDLTSYANSIALNEHIGIRIKYFTATITATVTNSQNYVVISSQNLDNVFSGMRVSGTSIPANSVLGDVHTNRIYLRDEYTGSLKNASGTNGTYTLTLSGQLMQFRKSNSSFDNDLLFGPPHIVLPLKYTTAKNNTSPNGDLTDWSMVIGDTSAANDTQWTIEIIDDKPVLPEPSWTYTYSDWTDAPATVTNRIQIKYHRYGSTFNDSWTPPGKSTLEDGTFNLYFWKTNDNSLTQLGRITNQQQTSSSSSYSTATYDVTGTPGTTGYLLFILYGWNFYRADMGIGSVIHQYHDNSTKQILYSPSSNSTTAKNGQTWERTARSLPSVNSFSSSTVTDIENEIATKSQSLGWVNLSTGTSTTGGWQQDAFGTSSGSTGPSLGSDNDSTSYYIYVETSSQTNTSVIAYASLRVPITLGFN